MFTVSDNSERWTTDRIAVAPSACATAELLAAIANIDLNLAQQVLVKCQQAELDEGSHLYARIGRLTAANLKAIKGMTPKRIERILAAIELGKRIQFAAPRPTIIDSPDDAYGALSYDLAISSVEKGLS